jgi:hypothetical protein
MVVLVYSSYTNTQQTQQLNLHMVLYLQCVGEPGSSVSIVSGYGLDYREIEVRSPAEAKGFFL